MAQKKVIIIGASSGIGLELAKIFSKNDFHVGLAARRLSELEKLQQELSGPSNIVVMDVAQTDDAKMQLNKLIEEMGGADIVVINAGVGWSFPTPEQELQTLQINAVGFVALFIEATEYFKKNNSGHIVGVSSIASLRGSHLASAYSASKALISNYMEGMRIKFYKQKLNINVTDIRPGFVATPMTEKNKGMFWVATAERAAQQIFDAILAQKEVVYITHRWGIIALIYKLLPNFLLKRI